MSRFNSIDPKLVKLATKLGGTLRKDRPSYSEEIGVIEERRIDWTKDDIHRAIIIQPNFEYEGVNHNIWHFYNIAWTDLHIGGHRLKWTKRLIKNGEFDQIESSIDELLRQSEENLCNISMKDLK